MLYFKNFFYVYATEGVGEFIKENIKERDFLMSSTEMDKEHELFGGDFEILLTIIIHKVPIIFH